MGVEFPFQAFYAVNQLVNSFGQLFDRFSVRLSDVGKKTLPVSIPGRNELLLLLQ